MSREYAKISSLRRLSDKETLWQSHTRSKLSQKSYGNSMIRRIFKVQEWLDKNDKRDYALVTQQSSLKLYRPHNSGSYINAFGILVINWSIGSIFFIYNHAVDTLWVSYIHSSSTRFIRLHSKTNLRWNSVYISSYHWNS